MLLTDLTTRVATVIQDTANKLSANDRAAAVQRAIVQRYSKDHPVLQVVDIPGNGNTGDLPVPAGWENGFSQVIGMEYPVGQIPSNGIENYDWQMYRSPTGIVIRLLVDVPEADEVVRTTWTLRHAADASTVYPQDEDAVVDLAASYCFESLAAIYAQTGDSSIAADLVNYRSKGQEYLNLAKAARKRYCTFFGIEDDGRENAIAKPALIVGDMNNLMGPGVDRMTHRRPR